MGHEYHAHETAEDLRHLHRHAQEAKRDLQAIQETLATLRASIGRIEKSVGLQQAAHERLEKLTMALAEQLTGDAAKFDAFTTGYGAVIDSAVTRILEEIAKQGTVSAETQAAADVISGIANNLTALNAGNLQRVMDAGLPPVVPPAPEPVPPVPEPIPPVDPVIGGRRR